MDAYQDLDGQISRPRILLVDDQDSIRDWIYTVLEGAGYEILTANSGPAALAICRLSIHPIELLVTDYQMPGMSGMELARECARLHGDLPILYVSGHAPDDALKEELQDPRCDFLGKPFRAPELLRKARALLLATPRKQLSLLQHS
jgi:two-component system, cell cycle sensor histidine kinase and response regulator CckA